MQGNPYGQLLADYRERKISLDEMLLTLYTETIKDKKTFSAFRRRLNPEMPSELVREIGALKSAVSRFEDSKNFGAIKELKDNFYKNSREKHKNYYTALNEVDSCNRANLAFLKEMYEFLKDKAQPYALQVRDLIEEYAIPEYLAA